jgi:Uncharacterized protein conserved in bacteria (DUF2252)
MFWFTAQNKNCGSICLSPSNSSRASFLAIVNSCERQRFSRYVRSGARTACRERPPIHAAGKRHLLGWTEGRRGRHFYFRQVRDAKIKFAVETFHTAEMMLFAEWCGYSLALSHARSGDPAVISGYMGKSDTFDKAIAAFSVAYADQNEKDHAALKRAIRDGKVEAVFEKAK